LARKRRLVSEPVMLRTDKISGLVTLVFGLLMIGFGAFSLAIVGFQRLVITGLMQDPQNADMSRVAEGMKAVHGVWFIYLPLMMLGGLVFVVSGFFLSRGSLTARRIAQINAICGYMWGIAYSMSCYQIMDVVMPQTPALPDSARTAFMWGSLVGGTLINAAFPTALLYLLSRPASKGTERRVANR
jgi:hypothetical protein